MDIAKTKMNIVTELFSLSNVIYMRSKFSTGAKSPPGRKVRNVKRGQGSGDKEVERRKRKKMENVLSVKRDI